MIKGAVVGGVAAIVALVAGCKPSPGLAGQDDAASTAPPEPKAAPVAPAETGYDKIAKLKTYDDAIAFAKPLMEDSVNKMDEGTALLALWSAQNLRWSDVAVTKNETSFASVLKDPDEARGKRICASGAIIQIEVEKTKTGKVYDGLMHDYASNLYKFEAVRSTGDLVAESQARLCGVITGKYDYSNSGGGTGHAIKVVGMFDLPANRTTVRPAAVVAPVQRGASAKAGAADPIDDTPAPPPVVKTAPVDPECNPPYTIDEATGRKKYKMGCLK